jgi:hypothetical protein
MPHDFCPFLVVEAPDYGSDRPLDDGRNAEGDESERGAYDLAATGVVVSSALDAHGDAQRDAGHGDPDPES